MGPVKAIDLPTVYATPSQLGTPNQLATLFDSIAQLVEREPDDTFDDEAVRKSARGLTDLLERRLIETD
jgi:hypothetical protein